MAKSLNKVVKKVTKKKGNTNALHENSRDAKKLRKAASREDRLSRLAAVRVKLNQPYLQRVGFFRDIAQSSSGTFDIEESQRLVLSYIHRDNDELDSLKSERRPGRPPSNREDLLKQRIAAEQGEYSSGFWIPDLSDESNLEKLRVWNEEWSSLGQISFVRVHMDGRALPSSFPPKSLS
ncbi:hypothetical protein MMC10_003030 [Thelotrema lepadinum]|nr:hypothetical protein [Thelotrema lepadinum]